MRFLRTLAWGISASVVGAAFVAEPQRRRTTSGVLGSTTRRRKTEFLTPTTISSANKSDTSIESSRRQIIDQIQASLLSSLLVAGGSITPAFAEEADKNNTPTKAKTIIITGANSGIGFEACKRLASQGHTLVLACRSIEKAQDAAERINMAVSSSEDSKILPAECDLADLQSIKIFAKNVPELIGTSKIDTLCLNAGLARNTDATDCARTKDGFELTVGTNHFGHFYLTHLLLPNVAADGRIVVTASAVHDPDSPGGSQGKTATLGDLKGLEEEGRNCEMIDGGSFNADKAYKDSKLCNVFFTRELQRRLAKSDSTKRISVNCFSPGLIVGTGLFRDQNPFFTKLFDFAATDLLKVGESVEWGGGSLEYMTTVSTKGVYYNSKPGSSKYGNEAYGREFAPSQVSKEAQDFAKGERFWKLSEKVLGIAV